MPLDGVAGNPAPVPRSARAAVRGLAVVLVALLAWPGAAAASHAEPAAPVSPVTEAADPPAALAAARKSGQPVEITGLRTETSQVFANPSGSTTLEEYVLPQRARKDGRWVPIDTTLRRQADGSVRPGATTVDLRLSAGGSGPLVTIAKGGRELTLAWPDPLPAPALAGDTATYPEVLPGVDLQVRAEDSGFFQALVVKNAAAATNPALRRIRWRLATAGLTVRATAEGASTAVDEHGKVIFTAPAPAMWDSSGEPRISARQKVMGLELRPDELAVVPDQAMLTAPDTKYPVYLDPSYSGAQNVWAPVFKDMPNTSFWTNPSTITNARESVRVGYQNWSSDVTQGVWRSLFRVSTAPIAGGRVIRTWVSINLEWSAASAATNVDLHTGGFIDPATAMTWNNTNSYFTGERSSANYLVTVAAANSNNSCSTSLAKVVEFGSDKLTNLVQTTADNATSTLTFGLKAYAEDNRNLWKKFCPGSAKLIVEYNTPPRAPDSLSTVPPTGCGTATAPAAINTATPTFSAVASDPDTDNVTTDVEILSGETVVGTMRSATVGSGSAFTWNPLPAGVLPADNPGAVFSYRARSWDSGGLAGAYGTRCYFTVDLVRPATPTISSTDYPNGTVVRSVGEQGTVAVTKAAGDTDVAGFRYGFSQDRITQWVQIRPDGFQYIPVTLWPTVPGTTIGIDRDLYVQAVDRAGNASAPTAAWRLRAGGATVTSPPVRGDVNGDRRADVLAVVDHGDGRTAAWSVQSKATNFNPGYIAWDSGISGGFPSYRIRSVPGDFDGDGRTDLAIFREDPDQQVRLFFLRSDGNRLEALSQPVWEGSGYRLSLLSVSAADVNADGFDDVLALQALAGNQTRLYVHFGGFSGQGAQVLQWDSGAGGFAGDRARVVGGDFDGDGDGDAAVFQPLAGSQTRLHVLLSDRTRLGAPVLRWDSGAGGFAGERADFAAANLDGDATGRDEVVARYDLGTGATRLVAFLPATGNWTTSTWWDSGAANSYPATRVSTLATGDFTGDGRDDVAMLFDPGGGARRLDTFVSSGTGFAAPRVDWWPSYVADTQPAFSVEPGRPYRLIAKHSGKCAEIQSGQTANGTPLRQWGCTAGATNQQYLVNRVGATRLFNLAVVATGKCVEVDGWKHDDNAKIQQWACGGTSGVPQANQEFELRYVEGAGLDVVVQLAAAHSGKCVNVAGASLTDGASLVQWPCGNPPFPNDQFYLRPEP